MKPKDLKYPFICEKRQMFVYDHIWYVPNQYTDFASFSFPGWNHSSFFNQERPVCLEYCSGNGTWITNRAREQAEYNWVAIERKFDRVRKIWSKMKNLQLSNLLTICGEGHCVTYHYIPNQSVHSIFINFPDPWPKKRHAKHRLIQVPFIKEVYRVLQIGSLLTIVTDDAAYSQSIIEVLHQFSGFESVFADPFYVTNYPLYGTSYFEDLWRQKGKIIRYHMFRKITHR